jgi:hypothetical protein
MRKIRLFQRDAYIGIDFLEKKAEVIRMKGAGDEDAFTFDIETKNGTKSIAVSNPQIRDGNAIKMELEHFRDAILYNKPVPVSEVDGLRAMDVAHQILQKFTVQSLCKYPCFKHPAFI